MTPIASATPRQRSATRRRDRSRSTCGCRSTTSRRSRRPSSTPQSRRSGPSSTSSASSRPSSRIGTSRRSRSSSTRSCEARPAVVSFVYGVPPPEVVEAAHERGILVVGTATTVDEAVALDRGGVDAIVATGCRGGGHRVTFLRRRGGLARRDVRAGAAGRRRGRGAGDRRGRHRRPARGRAALALGA